MTKVNDTQRFCELTADAQNRLSRMEQFLDSDFVVFDHTEETEVYKDPVWVFVDGDGNKFTVTVRNGADFEVRVNGDSSDSYADIVRKEVLDQC